MNLLDGLILQANYNSWINQRLLDASEKLTPEERYSDLGAYFDSIAGTFNHLIVGDTIWLRRFLGAPIGANVRLAEQAADWLPEPIALDQMLLTDWNELRAMRARLDLFITEWVSMLTPKDTNHVLSYQNTRGRPFKRNLGLLLVHYFNHQTHHRGQITALLFQNGIDPGITDLLQVIPELDFSEQSQDQAG